MSATLPEFEVFSQYLKANGLKETLHRKLILRTFLDGEGHRTVEDIYRAASREEPRIGYTTVYRTMKLLSESGLARRIDLADGVTRYEHLYNHSHHDHLICTECGRSIEFLNPEIEQVQESASARLGFQVVDHRLQIYGLCDRCRG